MSPWLYAFGILFVGAALYVIIAVIIALCHAAGEMDTRMKLQEGQEAELKERLQAMQAGRWEIMG